MTPIRRVRPDKKIKPLFLEIRFFVARRRVKRINDRCTLVIFDDTHDGNRMAPRNGLRSYINSRREIYANGNNNAATYRRRNERACPITFGLVYY